ncbi:hypothetical protein WQ54_19245 [Bacillus sp. SA1-12]|uniref:peptidoglycan-binding domain-containing protein n=1 Tax=Bacillus sp. SA1-12 TaxID=1455638 RepID=UPI000627013A|nr:peptidoglycan-binding protein [Bacillus sp. SA1-12]KKI90738.1 hypothetical protein WQ54_19245 [Bacillus sp. SA1-12]
MKNWKKVTATVLTASALLFGVPSEGSAAERIDYSIFAYPKTGMIKEGARGENIKILQRALNEKVKAGLKEDGVYGPLTSKAELVYQKTKSSLVDDGIYGPKTHASHSQDINSFGLPSNVLKVGSRGKPY